jgi:hypothetical protein
MALFAPCPPSIQIVTLNGGHAEPVIGRRFAPTRWLCPPYDLFIASVRAAITSASVNNTAASRNGAPGNFVGACGPMK